MATYKFSVLPGVIAPETAPALSLTNIRPVTPPAGRVRDLLDRMSGSYSAFQVARIAQTLFDLDDAGLLEALDLLCIRGLNSADSLINWAGTGALANSGAVFTPGEGFSTDGSSQSISLQFDSLQANAVPGDATLFAYRPITGVAGQIFGREGGGDQLVSMTVGLSNSSGRLMKTSPNAMGAHGGGVIGLWSITSAGTDQILRRGASVIALLAEVTTASLPSGIAFGRDNTTHHATQASAFGYGRALTPGQLAVLQSAIEAMHRVI